VGKAYTPEEKEWLLAAAKSGRCYRDGSIWRKRASQLAIARLMRAKGGLFLTVAAKQPPGFRVLDPLPDGTRFEPGPWKHNFRVDDSAERVRQRVRRKEMRLWKEICYAYWWWGFVAQLFWLSTNQSNYSGRQMAEAAPTV